MYLLALKNRCQKNDKVSTYDFPNAFLFILFVYSILVVKPYNARFAGLEAERIIIHY